MSKCNHCWEIVGVDRGQVIYGCINCGQLRKASILWPNKPAPYRIEVVNA